MNRNLLPKHRVNNRNDKRADENRVAKPASARYAKTSDRRNALAANAVLYLHAHVKDGNSFSKPQHTGSVAGQPGSSANLNPLDWNPAHFRLFVGNLGPDANDVLLATAFGPFSSVSKVNVPVDRITGKNKGYGFVAFSDADDYLQAFQKMNGAYIGQHPVQLKRAEPIKKPAKTKSGRGKK